MDIVKTGQSIAEARKKRGLTQEELAEKCGVSMQAVSKWENGRNLPDIENLMRIAEITNVPYSVFLEAGRNESNIRGLYVKDRLFQEDNMFTRLRTFALSENLTETYRALQYIREHHAGQYRKQAKYTTERVLYINHPLLMACQAHAAGVRDDQLLAAVLLHDVVEDTGVTAEELPFSEEVRETVQLVSFSVPEGQTVEQAKEAYYRKIGQNAKASVVKLLDRCNNVSTMSGAFTRERMRQYILETEEYILPLASFLKNNYPEYSDLAFLVKYQIVSILETIKYLML